jgi:hypothetical protein
MSAKVFAMQKFRRTERVLCEIVLALWFSESNQSTLSCHEYMTSSPEGRGGLENYKIKNSI